MAEQSNITLRFDAEDGGAEKGLLDLEKTERKLEAAVKVGNRTLRERINTEADLSKVLDKVRQGEERAATAGQRRAAASLAAQKSAALLAELNAKAAREQRMATGWEAAAARAAMETDRRNHERMMNRKREMAAAMESQRGAFGRGFSGALSFSTSLLGIGTAAATATAALRAMTAAHEHQMDVAKRSDASAVGMKEFIALQKPGAAGQQHVKDTILRGASMGLTPEQAAALAQPIQSVTDTDGSGSLEGGERAAFDEDFAAAGRLVQMGISPKDAQTVITAGRSRGRGGRMSADKLIAAADVSAAGPADFARAASAMGQFEDSDTALAVATALTQEEKNFEQIPTLVRGAALSLGSAADDSELSKKFGLKGLSEAEKIAKLREIGKTQGKGDTEAARIADFSRSLKNYGLDEEKARAVGILVRQGESVESTRARLAGVQPGLVDEKVAGLMADPIAGSQMRAQIAAGTAAAEKVYGAASPAARDRRAAALARGAELSRFGGQWAVDPETGEEKSAWNPATWAGRARAMFNGMPGTGFNRGGANQDPSLSGAEKLEIQIAELNKALRENTEATKQNSSSGGGKPVGGAASNAEEKY